VQEKPLQQPPFLRKGRFGAFGKQKSFPSLQTPGTPGTVKVGSVGAEVAMRVGTTEELGNCGIAVTTPARVTIMVRKVKRIVGGAW